MARQFFKELPGFIFNLKEKKEKTEKLNYQ
jgi:hypothetical protein